MKPRRKRAKAVPRRAGGVRRRGVSRTGAAAQAPPVPARDVGATRELFWQNVMREILTNLSMVSAQQDQRGPGGSGGGNPDSASLAPSTGEAAGEENAEEMELFDGRLAVITRQGQRIPIASVFPMFACGIEAPGARALALEVECTVFQIRTPGGEVFTLPLEEMRTFHALTPGLMRNLEKAARREARRRGASEDEERIPFGFAAFTSLARGGPSIVPIAPVEPME
jgi:hypothetical protein